MIDLMVSKLLVTFKRGNVSGSTLMMLLLNLR